MVDNSSPAHNMYSGEIAAERQARYSAWLQWFVIGRCNFRCVFCHAGVHGQKRPLPERLRLAMSQRARETIRIPELMKTLDETGRIFRVGFTGGEPFLISNFVEACEAITRKHYISINTNLTSPHVPKFCERIDPQRVVCIAASTHLKELERSHLMKRHIDHVLLCKEKGFSIHSQEVAYPPLLEEAEKYRSMFKQIGIDLFYKPFYGEYQGKRYPQSYTDREKEIFRITLKVDRYNQKGKLCNAGYNIAVVSSTGTVSICTQLKKEVLGNIYRKIVFRDKMIICPLESCVCPAKAYDKVLFSIAAEECGCGQL